MKRYLAILFLLLSGLSLQAETVECKVVPSLLPVWAEKECGSTILGYLRTGTMVQCPEDKDSWVRVPLDGGALEGWTFKYGGVLYPWDPEYDSAYYDGIMFDNIRETDAPPALKEYYRRKAGVDFPVDGSLGPGFDEELSKLSDAKLLKALGSEARNALKPSGGMKRPGKWLFWTLAALLTLCFVLALRGGSGSSDSSGILLFVTGAVEIIYAWTYKDDAFWFLGSTHYWILNFFIILVFAALMVGQLILFRSVNKWRTWSGLGSNNRNNNYLFWVLGAVLVGIGRFCHPHTFFWWVGTAGVPALLFLVAVLMLFDGHPKALRHGILYIVSGLGFSLMAAGLLKAAIIVILGFLFLRGAAEGGVSSSGGGSRSREEDEEENKCQSCYWYKYFDKQSHTGFCFPKEYGEPDYCEKLEDVDESRYRKPCGGNGCQYFDHY